MTSAPTENAVWKSRIVGEGEEAPDQLLAHPLNWRIHPSAQADALRDVLEQVGFVQRVVVNRQTGRLVDGHLRVDLALRAGVSRVPVIYVDLDEHEEALVLATLDPLSALARTDSAKLEELFDLIQTQSQSITAVLEGLIQTPAADDAHVSLDRRYVLLAFLPEELETLTAALDDLGGLAVGVEALWFAGMGVEKSVMARLHQVVQDAELRNVSEALVALTRIPAEGPA